MKYNFSTLNKLKARQRPSPREPGWPTRINCGDPAMTRARGLNPDNKTGSGEDLNKTKTQSTQEREINENELTGHTGHTH